MELTKQEQDLIKKIRTTKQDETPTVITIKYTPLGETGHTQSLLFGTHMPITGLRKSLVQLLNDVKKLHKQGYNILVSYDHLIDSITVYEMKSVKKVMEVEKIKPPIRLTKSYHKEK